VGWRSLPPVDDTAGRRHKPPRHVFALPPETHITIEQARKETGLDRQRCLLICHARQTHPIIAQPFGLLRDVRENPRLHTTVLGDRYHLFLGEAWIFDQESLHHDAVLTHQNGSHFTVAFERELELLPHFHRSDLRSQALFEPLGWFVRQLHRR